MKADRGQQQYFKLSRMAKRKQQEPPKPLRGIPLPLDHAEIPEEWLPSDDFSSHRPMLYRAIMNTAHSSFIEFGTGHGSTPYLRELYAATFPDKEFISYENDFQWWELMLTTDYKHLGPEMAHYRNHYLNRLDNLIQVNIWPGSIVFIDCAPAELRKHLISKYTGAAKLIIVHDTEPGANYVYQVADILNSFKFRCDLLVEGAPQTTIVSNLYEFNEWKTIVNDNIQFI